MGIPDHLTCLLRNLYAGQEATVRTGHGTTDWFQIGKGVCQGCMLSPCLFNFYAEYIMRNAGLEEAQAGIKIAGRNINNLTPTQDVIEAFKAVETAKQQAEAVVNQALAYQNAKLPEAKAQADKLLQNAEYLKQKRINEAVEQVAMFEAMYAEYAQNPEITRSRMYYEAIAQILPGVKLYINTGSGSGIDMLLPLESLMGGAK